LPTTIVRAVISVQHYKWGHKLGASLRPGIKKPITQISLSLFSKKEKVQGSTFCWKMLAYSFLGLLRHYSLGVHGLRYES
jgi:hypothetical protein